MTWCLLELSKPPNSPGCSLLCGRFDQCRFQDQVNLPDPEGSPAKKQRCLLHEELFENSIIERGTRALFCQKLLCLVLLCASHLLQVATDFQSGALVVVLACKQQAQRLFRRLQPRRLWRGRSWPVDGWQPCGLHQKCMFSVSSATLPMLSSVQNKQRWAMTS